MKANSVFAVGHCHVYQLSSTLLTGLVIAKLDFRV